MERLFGCLSLADVGAEHDVEGFVDGGLFFFGGERRDHVVVGVVGCGVLLFGVCFGPFFVGAFDHFDGVDAEGFDPVFAEFLFGRQGFVADDFVDFGKFFDGALEDVVVFVLHVEGDLFFFDVQGALADALVFLAEEEAGDLLEGGMIEVRPGHGVEGVSLGENLEGGFGSFGAIWRDCLDKLGSVGDAFRKVMFVIEAMQGRDVGFEVQPLRTRLGGAKHRFFEGELVEPSDQCFLIFESKVEKAIVAAGFGEGDGRRQRRGKII